jgi:hypothetical protein
MTGVALEILVSCLQLYGKALELPFEANAVWSLGIQLAL